MPDNHRHCYLLTGSPSEILADFLCLSQLLASPLVVAHDVNQYDASPSSFSTCSFKHIRQHLGRSHEAILVDLTHGVSASALAILAGTVRGNGVFAIGLPKHNWQRLADQDLSRYLPWPYKPEQITSYFKLYLFALLHKNTSPFIQIHSHQLRALPALETIIANPPLTQEQTTAQACLLSGQARSYVLMAPRGRGKSTLLGDTLATLTKAGKRVAITAPNQNAIATLKQRFATSWGATQTVADLPFFAPDAMLLESLNQQENPKWDYLFVDEASMIPLPMLEALSQLAIHSVFSTTDYGYEGAGKGFGLRFCPYLEHKKAPPSSSLSALKHLTLDTPIRWGENDPLEKWINETFFLSPNHPIFIAQESQNAPAHYAALSGADWLSQPMHLANTFHLLVSAHYQTSPDNLRWIFDDPSVTTYLSTHNNALNSVAVVTKEGHLPDALSHAVLQGTRRPRGHLVPQSLLAHEGITNAGQYCYWRISRIATEPSLQHQGLASQLLNHIENRAALENGDFLCASFAATVDVVAFWQKNGFTPVRLGTAKDQASGHYSFMMVKPISQPATLLANQWHQHFVERFVINVLLQYKDLSAELMLLMLRHSPLSVASRHEPSVMTTLSPQDEQDIALFVDHHRPFDSIRPAILNVALLMAQLSQLSHKNPIHRLFLSAALGRDTEADRKKANMSGKKAMLAAFKTVLRTRHTPP
ncbi:GNAT family N-acetyltransferase [Marinomonas sp. IMCC 4694]|uniref:GNAT family N-acetyltransferase n=1 Tax=Marinomonas sp. IMCC 4694 TaxID=2605432 RepID=UPI0011E7CC5A|nr:GNAT family N-acetyltransferase [Marinomonas sp. IMCC 4694]TYL46949.1 tRNA(Met) cytidine acetyltransferase [Marinomonas sp. IMCC 4694]